MQPSIQYTNEYNRSNTMNCQIFLQDLIQQELVGGQEEVDADADLLGGGIIDSVGLMWLVGAIEDKLDLSIPLEDITIENFRTIAAITAYLQARNLAI